ncbi:MAG: hypothetical protein WCF67_17660, partial [Chitinophagaceae bacterium]
SGAGKYPSSNDFNRKGDVLLRSAYNFMLHKKLNVHAGLLAIYHLAEDTYIDANISNSPISIKGSKGTTLNITAAANYALNNKISIGLSGGIPLIVRDVRPDGLTRHFVIAPELIIKF